MSSQQFIKTTLEALDEVTFNKLKKSLINNKLISFSFFNEDNITCPVMMEKLCDFFERAVYTSFSCTTFLELEKKYMEDLNSLVECRIAQSKKTAKNEPLIVPRARKYYERARQIYKQEKFSIQDLIDYSRIMLCLYTESIRYGFGIIDDFDYSTEHLELKTIIDAMLGEKINGKKPRFNIEDPYGLKRSTFVMTIIVFYYIKSKEVIGEYSYVPRYKY